VNTSTRPATAFPGATVPAAVPVLEPVPVQRVPAPYDAAYGRVSINGAEVEAEPDGSWVIVVSDEDPGHPNWLASQSRATGNLWCRWFLPERTPDRPMGAVVPLAEVPGHPDLPDGCAGPPAAAAVGLSGGGREAGRGQVVEVHDGVLGEAALGGTGGSVPGAGSVGIARA
jgi:hypothetical protein